MLYSSSGGSSPRRLPRAARRCAMARRPDRRPSRAATDQGQHEDHDDADGDEDLLDVVQSRPREERHVPNMTGPGGRDHPGSEVRAERSFGGRSRSWGGRRRSFGVSGGSWGPVGGVRRRGLRKTGTALTTANRSPADGHRRSRAAVISGGQQ